MKILEIKELKIPEIKIIKFAKFCDHRGYFTETFRNSDFENIDFMSKVKFIQCNESYSKPGTIRGLHFQWNPFMGKLVRTLKGRMVDIVLDIRKESPTFGKIIAYDMPQTPEMDYNEWIWVPPGFAHGNFFSESTSIEYFCSGSYNPSCEAGISPFSKDIDWSLCDKKLKNLFEEISKSPLVTDKDKNGYSLNAWSDKPESENFSF